MIKSSEEARDFAARLASEAVIPGDLPTVMAVAAMAQELIDTAKVVATHEATAVKAEPHCPSCTCGRRAPVQSETKGSYGPAQPAGTVSWAEHEECHRAYAIQHSGQSAERIAERGGFGYYEYVLFLGHEPTTWRAR